MNVPDTILTKIKVIVFTSLLFSAEVERLFSQVVLIKTSHRANIKIQPLSTAEVERLFSQVALTKTNHT
jgi:hypothetical protein